MTMPLRERSRTGAVRRLLLLVLSVALAACSQNVEKIEKDTPVPPPPAPLSVQLGQASPGEVERDRLGRGTPPGITGEIRLAPELEGMVAPEAALFVFARVPGGGPVAAKRLGQPTFPVRFFLGQESVMLAEQALTGQVDIEVRVSQSGAAGPPNPGDLFGTCADNPVTVGDTGVHEIIVDTVQ